MTESDVSRRRFLAGAGALVGAAALGGIAGAGASEAIASARDGSAGAAGAKTFGSIEPFYGIHQSGIQTAVQAHGAFASFTLVEGFDREAAIRLMRVVTDMSAKLTAGVAPMSDNDPKLADGPARLTITAGFGKRFFELTGTTSKIPAGFVDIPTYSIDRLEEEWSGGDFFLQFGSDDPLVLAHALRHLSRSIRTYASPKWVQRGFTHAIGIGRPVGTPRNLMGQVDGTANPLSPEDYEDQVWVSAGPAWLHGGTMVVLRRIEMELDTWDALDTPAKELSVGRNLANGAPLTGSLESDEPDYEAVDQNGLPVIPTIAHIRRAHTGNPRHKFLRRPFNYDEGTNAKGHNEAGLLFAVYTTDIAERYIPVQNALAEVDLLNQWTTPVGSAVFVVPPGCAEGGYIGETLLS